MPRGFLRFLILLAFIPKLAAQPGNRIFLAELEENTNPEALTTDWNADRSAEGSLSWSKTLSGPFRIHLLHIDPPPADPGEWIENFRHLPGVRAAQWDYPLEFHAIPDDPDYPLQWSLPHTGAEEVWDQTTGGLTAAGDTIVVAVLDAGFDLSHPDLAANIWLNRGEIPGDGLDNDNNGYTDDLQGWNFADDSPEHPVDAHGTSVAGIIGAVGNNGEGIAGINWSVKMMPFTTTHVSDVIEAYSYILDQRRLYRESHGEKGAFVVATNASFGLAGVFCYEQPVWAGMYDLLGREGILTTAATANEPVNVDQEGDMPSTCASPFLIAVLQTGKEDEKGPSSAYGPFSIDLGAPGTDILSTRPGGNYGSFGGTSAAAPHVCGAIGLLYSMPCALFAANALETPLQTALAVKDAILRGAVPVEDLHDLTITGGRLSVANSFEILGNQCINGLETGLGILKIFPNPAIAGIEIEYLTNGNEPLSFRLFTSTGQMIREETPDPFPWAVKRFYLDLPSLPRGVYFLSLTDGRSSATKAFFVD